MFGLQSVQAVSCVAYQANQLRVVVCEPDQKGVLKLVSSTGWSKHVQAYALKAGRRRLVRMLVYPPAYQSHTDPYGLGYWDHQSELEEEFGVGEYLLDVNQMDEVSYRVMVETELVNEVQKNLNLRRIQVGVLSTDLVVGVQALNNDLPNQYMILFQHDCGVLWVFCCEGQVLACAHSDIQHLLSGLKRIRHLIKASEVALVGLADPCVIDRSMQQASDLAFILKPIQIKGAGVLASTPEIASCYSAMQWAMGVDR